MGYKDEIFEEQVDDELKCPICEKVLEAPVQGVHCEHLFCLNCIKLWLKNSLVCPLDRRPLLPSQLQPAPRIILRLLNNLKIRCNYHDYGCLMKLKLSELKQHVRVCPYNPGLHLDAQKSKKLEFKNRLKNNNTSNQINEIKRFRMAGDMSSEIGEIDRIVRDLKEDFDYEHRKSLEFVKNLEIAQLNYEQLNQKFLKIVNPFLNLLKSGYESNVKQNASSTDREPDMADQQSKAAKQLIDEHELNSGSIIAEERQTCTAIIRNLNEFLNEQVVEEYLRQNDIPTLSCELELNISRVRSRDFKVVFYRNDFHKLFNESLWPTGVTLHSLSSNRDNQIIFGKRSADLPCLFIKSGLALSYY